jgi:thymidylate synthase (FAD)
MLLNFFTIEDFKDSFPYTALGARVCYNSGDLNSLLNDPRVVEKQKRAEFLSKLGNYKHFSVFAHSFVYKKVGEENALRIGATYFKTHYNPKYPDVIGVSLRHYLEELLKVNESEYFKAFEKLAEYDTPTHPIEIHTEGSLTVSLIGLNKEYDGYAVFFIDGVSRTMTHQLVRHTTLNFSQRSQRYVKEDENYTVIPPSILENEDALKLVKLYDNLATRIYNTLVYGYKIKREDARFFLPIGRRTTIVVSGTLNWINDFIEKRNTPHAQWEIRKVADIMKKLLQDNISNL